MATEEKLVALEWRIWRELDLIHDEFLARMGWLARSVGQRTRADR